MSQDRFWEHWGGSSGSKPEERGGGKPGETPGDLNYDVLAAWLKEPPENDTLAPVADPNTPHSRASDVDLSTAWPGASSVDPFQNLQPGGASAGGGGAEWDLVLETGPAPVAPRPPAGTGTTIGPAVPPVNVPRPPAIVPPPQSSAPAPPSTYDTGFFGGGAAALPGMAPPVLAPPPPIAVSPAPRPPTGPAPAEDLGFDLGAIVSPRSETPNPNWFETAPVVPDARAASPRGEAYPPPPREPNIYTDAGRAAGGDAPLKLEVNIGRRTIEQVLTGEALIGRPDTTRGLHPEIDLRLDDAVSRRHAQIIVRNGTFLLKDLNSTNGTRFNRQFLRAEEEVPLRPGDEIEVGEMTLIRVLEAPIRQD